MKQKLLKELNLVREVYTLLYNHCNEITFQQLKDGLLQKFQLDKRTTDCLDTLILISEYITKRLTTPKERLDFYFKKLHETELYFAWFVLAPDEGYQLKSLSEIAKDCKTLTQEEQINKMYSYVKYSRMIYEEDKEEKSEVTFHDFYQALNKAELLAEEKWHIVNILYDLNPYLEELVTIVQEAQTLLLECQKEIDVILDEFYKYWSNKFLSTNVYDYIKEATGSEFNKDQQYAVILPSLTMCNGIGFYSEDKNPEGDTIYIGVLYGENFHPGMKKEKDIFLSQYLKLLSDKSKFDILMNIKDKKVYGAELAKLLNLSTPTISYHMTALLNAGLVNIERENKRIYYFMNKEKMAEFIKTMESLFL
ncbi:transcriptional regulator [Anaerocolumna cellulosilytica]|uniref:Transcriptional regulator n=1 Tax=Anaerocolumna cellulosilytica TaxID=433286 RepID=A0A6S6QXQ6_9FIRM|nr:metalloregulator ArsR/SmtB family transcription factor [Anaerocolumna cellulosilytica]MBB5194282.1 DNA-binding transcriptional ArsR family regulator [Anaerocolumna cellulosilytica]BCJ94506.1 transcriptional regulator [Anaerocolumna cellulosilytica]